MTVAAPSLKKNLQETATHYDTQTLACRDSILRMIAAQAEQIDVLFPIGLEVVVEVGATMKSDQNKMIQVAALYFNNTDERFAHAVSIYRYQHRYQLFLDETRASQSLSTSKASAAIAVREKGFMNQLSSAAKAQFGGAFVSSEGWKNFDSMEASNRCPSAYKITQTLTQLFPKGMPIPTVNGEEIVGLTFTIMTKGGREIEQLIFNRQFQSGKETHSCTGVATGGQIGTDPEGQFSRLQAIAYGELLPKEIEEAIKKEQGTCESLTMVPSSSIAQQQRTGEAVRLVLTEQKT